MNKKRQIHHRLLKIPHVGAVCRTYPRRPPGKDLGHQNRKLAVEAKEGLLYDEYNN